MALNSNSDSFELLDSAFNSNIYFGKIENALKIISKIELVADDLDQKFLYPTIAEEVRRGDLDGAFEVSQLLGLENHNVLLKEILSAWNYAFLGQKGNSLSKLDSFSEDNIYSSELFYYIKIHALLISSYFSDQSEVENRYKEIINNLDKIPPRYYLFIAKVVYDKIDQDQAKNFLATNLPQNLDFEVYIGLLKDDSQINQFSLLANVFFEMGYIVARSEGLFNSIPFFWYSLYINEKNTEARLILSSFYSNMNQKKFALKLLDDNLHKSPSWIILNFEKSYLYEEMNNVDLAISLLEKFKKDERYRTKTLLRISNIYRRNENYKRSLNTLNSIQINDNTPPEIYYYKSLNFVMLKDWKNAIKSFDVLLEKYPESPEVLNFVGYTLVDRNVRLKEGIDLIKKAVSNEPQNGFYLDSLGWAYFKLGEIDKAIIYLERSVELEPQEMEITDHLGDAYWEVKRYKEAELVWKRALTLSGNNDIYERIEMKLNRYFKNDR
mgnify:FL=1